jgi:hypothetical protein
MYTKSFHNVLKACFVYFYRGDHPLRHIFVPFYAKKGFVHSPLTPFTPPSYVEDVAQLLASMPSPSSIFFGQSFNSNILAYFYHEAKC